MQSDLRLRPMYLFELTQKDMLLILKALGGRLKPEEQQNWSARHSACARLLKEV